MGLKRKDKHIEGCKSVVLGTFSATFYDNLENKVKALSKESGLTFKSFSAMSNYGTSIDRLNPLFNSSVEDAAHAAIGVDISNAEDKIREQQMKQALKALVAY